MNNKFNAAEVLEMAMEIEKKGKAFYRKQARIVQQKETKDFFFKLADEEQKHYETFKELSQSVRKEMKNKQEINYIYDYQVSAYLNTLVEFTVFPPLENQGEDTKIESLDEVLTVAIMAEKDSILFYQEILNNNKGKTADISKKIIEEEKTHLLDLINFKEKYK